MLLHQIFLLRNTGDRKGVLRIADLGKQQIYRGHRFGDQSFERLLPQIQDFGWSTFGKTNLVLVKTARLITLIRAHFAFLRL